MAALGMSSPQGTRSQPRHRARDANTRPSCIARDAKPEARKATAALRSSHVGGNGGDAPSKMVDVPPEKASGLLAGFPVVIASSGSPDDSCLITLAFVYPMSVNPPMLGVGINPSRHSHAYFAKYPDFSLSIVDAGLLKPAKFCGSKSGRNIDKWEGAGLTPAPGLAISSPHPAEARAVIEVEKAGSFITGDHTCFFGRVAGAVADAGYENLENIIYWKGRYCLASPLP